MNLLNHKDQCIHKSDSDFIDTATILEVEQYLLNNEQASIYHHPLWLKTLVQENHQPFNYIISRNSAGQINGVLPLLKTKGLPFGISGILGSKRISSLPRTPYCGPLAENKSVYDWLIERAKKLCELDKNPILQIKTINNLPFNPLSKSYKWRITYIKHIPPKNEKIIFKDHKTERDILRSIKRAKANEIEIYKAKSIDQLKLWYKLYLEKMRFHYVPARPFTFFEALWNNLNHVGLLDVYLAVRRPNNTFKIFAGNINFKFNKKYYGGFIAGDMKNAKIMCGDLLHYQELLDLQEQGFNTYDLGEVAVNNHELNRYKRKWGAEQVQIYHTYFGSELGVNEPNLDFYNSHQLNKMIWRTLPLKVTEKIGSVINNRL